MRPTAILWIGALALTLWLGACASEQEVRISLLHHFDQGNAAFAAKDYPGAAHHYQAALDLNSDSPDIWYNLGLTFFHMADYPHAIEAFEAARTLAPTRAEIHYNLALAYHENYDLPSAHRSYHLYQALAGPPKDPKAGDAAAAAADGSDAVAGGAAVAAGGATAANAGGPPGAPRLTGNLARAPGAAEAQEALNAQAIRQAPTAQRARTGRPGPGPQGQPGDDDKSFEGNSEWWKEDLPRQ